MVALKLFQRTIPGRRRSDPPASATEASGSLRLDQREQTFEQIHRTLRAAFDVEIDQYAFVTPPVTA